MKSLPGLARKYPPTQSSHPLLSGWSVTLPVWILEELHRAEPHALGAPDVTQRRQTL